MSMASIRPVNWDDIGARHRPVNWVDIGARFGAPAFSSGQGSHVCHSTPQAQSQKKTKKAPADVSIQEGFAMNRISSGSNSHASHVEQVVPESAPAESTPGTSGKSHSMFAVMKNVAVFGAYDWIGLDNSLDSRYVEGRNGGHLPHLVQVGGRRWISNEGNLITSHTMKNPSALPSFFISTYLESNKNQQDDQEVEIKAGTFDSKVIA